jgi:cation diffusion facilitator family transporter
VRSEQSRRTLYRLPMVAAAVGVFINLALGAAKLAGGVLGDSFALIADAVNSFGDVVASAVVLAALIYAQRPADAQHPYGHTRAEAVAGAGVAILIVLSAAWIAWEAARRLPDVHGPPARWTLWLAGANVVVKEALFRYKRRVGRRSGSQALIANAWDHRSDALASAAVLAGLVAVIVGGRAWMWADEAAALLVAVAIAWSGVALFRTSASDLLDRQAEPELLRAVAAEAQRVEGVVAVESLRLRKSGLEYFADLHLEVDPDLTVTRGHAIGHRTKDRLLERFERLRDVLVHVEPADSGTRNASG